MRRSVNRRWSFGTLSKSRRPLVTTTPIFLTEPLEARRLLSAAFVPAANFAVGGNPESVAVGDFNGDGKADLAVADEGGGVSVLLGNGDGTFAPAVKYAVGSGPDSVAVGDFTGDGKLDLVVANADSNNVSVLLGNGNGTFQPAVNYTVGSGPSCVTVGAFTGNGKLDLAVTNFNNADVSVLLGNGDGTFQGAVNYPTGSEPYSVVTGDFRGDGKLDLAVANFHSNTVSVLLGNGNGTFQSAASYAAGNQPFAITAGDFNGNTGLAVANFGNNTINVLPGNGDGTFQAPVSYAAGNSPYGLTVGDFTGDGNVDLAAADNGGGVSVLQGNGDGTFQTALNFTAGNHPYSVTTGIFNNTGETDLAVANAGGNNVSVLLNSTGLAIPVYGNLSTALSVNYGTPSVTLSGTLAAGALIPPSSQVVSITLNGATQNAVIGAQGSFSTTFITSQFTASATPYVVNYAYRGDANFESATDDTTTTLTVMPLNPRAIPVFSNLPAPVEIPQGTAAVAVSGNIIAGALVPPSPEVVAITLNGVTQDASISAQGNFTTSFDTSALPASAMPYQVTYAYAGDTNFTAVSDNISTFVVIEPRNGTSVPVYRLYSPITDEHLYSSDLNEYNVLGTEGWNQEGIAYNDYNGAAALNGVTDVPLYRLYNTDTRQHLWTTSVTEYNTLRAQTAVWNNEGVAGYVFATPTAGTTALYRLSYPSPALHLWTVSQNEATTLANQDGWTSEGIACYVIGVQLVFVQQPTATAAGNTLPTIIVVVEDQSGNQLTADSSNITLAISSDSGAPSGTVLNGTLSEPAVNGVATFDNLAFNQGGNFTLLATDGAVNPVGSNSFLINGLLVPEYRLYNPGTMEHLYTTNLTEYTVLGGEGWNQEGDPFQVYNGPVTVDGVSAEPEYRLYDTVNQRHLWTTSGNEYDTLRQESGWNDEGIADYLLPAQVAGSTPLYRLNDPAIADLHLWTTDANEVATLATEGWTNEGIIGYVM